MPRRNREERLGGKIKLGAEAAADCGGNDAHGVFGDAENRGDILAGHVRRLRAGLNFDAVTDAARETCFGFNVGVLDEAGFIFGFDDDRRFVQCASRHRRGRRDRAQEYCPAEIRGQQARRKAALRRV